jgi:hypothetical protein
LSAPGSEPGSEPESVTPPRRAAPSAPGTAELLHELLRESPQSNGPGDKMLLSDLLERFQRRAFGVFLLIAVLPSFIPVAFGIGAISGGLAILCGVQLMLGFERPWLPKFARNFSLPRRAVSAFARRSESLFRRLEKVIKPRQAQFTQRKADVFTGFIIILMGVALTLPVPLTNFLFAVPLSILAFAMIERDGKVIAISWVLCTVVLVSFAIGAHYLSSTFVDLLKAWF